MCLHRDRRNCLLPCHLGQSGRTKIIDAKHEWCFAVYSDSICSYKIINVSTENTQWSIASCHAIAVHQSTSISSCTVIHASTRWLSDSPCRCVPHANETAASEWRQHPKLPNLRDPSSGCLLLVCRPSLRSYAKIKSSISLTSCIQCTQADVRRTWSKITHCQQHRTKFGERLLRRSRYMEFTSSTRSRRDGLSSF